MKSWPFYVVAVCAAFSIGALQQLTLGLLGRLEGVNLSALTATFAVAAFCTVLLYLGFRRSPIPMHLGQVLGSYVVSMVTTASVAISFSVPRIIFRDEDAVNVSLTVLVAAVIAAIVGGALAKFYKRSTPESPDDLT